MRESSFWNDTIPQIMSAYAVTVFVILWIGFALALAVNQEWLNSLWDWVRGLPLLLEIVVWVAFLPITAGLWIWQSSWPTLVRLAGWGGLIAWTLVAIGSLFRSNQ